MQVGRRDPLALAHPARTFWIVAVVTFVADQLTKSTVRVLWRATSPLIPWDRVASRLLVPEFGPGESVNVIGEYLQLTHVRNTGAAFGLFPGYQPVFIATSIVVLVVVGAYWRRSRPHAWPIVIALALIGGGALGNLVDRAVIGKVTDFFYVAVIDFPVFNIADSAILIGVTILVLWLFFGPQPQLEASSSDSQDEALSQPQGEPEAAHVPPEDAQA